MSAVFLVWYFAYVLLSVFAHDFMATKVWGDINIGLLIGLGQFVSTFVITGIYVRWANREFDPRAEAIRAELEERTARMKTSSPQKPPSAIPPPISGSLRSS